MVPGQQLAKTFICVDMERLPTLAIPSAALKDLLLICCTLFLKGQKSTLTKYDSGAHCTTAASTCLIHPPHITLGPGQDIFPALLCGFNTSSRIHKVVKSLIRRLSGALGQSCMSLPVSALIALGFVCYGSSMLAMGQV